MADNIELQAGSGGATIAADDISSVWYQRVKLTDGTADSATVIASGNGTATESLRVTVASDSTGVLSVDDNGGSLTVDGTVAATQSGTWNIADVTGTVSLPTGAATAAKQPALGTAGTAASDVISVQGIASMTALTVDGSGVTQPVSGTVTADAGTGPWPVTDNGGSLTVDGAVAATQSGTWNVTNVSGTVSLPTGASTAAKQPALGTAGSASSDVISVQGIASMTPMLTTASGNVASAATDSGNPVKIGAVFNTTQPTVTNGQRVNLQATARGALIVGTGVTNLQSNTAQINGVAPSMGNGASGTGVQRVTIASDSTGVVGLATGSNAIGKLAANSGVDIGDVDILSVAAGNNLIGNVGISGARTSGGTTIYRNPDVDETDVSIKGSAGQLYWIHAMNLTAATLFLQLYDATTASVTVGTTTPSLTFPLATQGDTNGAGFVLAIPNGIAFATAITIACTTTVGGSSGPATNGCIVNAGYA